MKRTTLIALKKGASEIKESASQHVLVCTHSAPLDDLARRIGLCLQMDSCALPVCEVSVPSMTIKSPLNPNEIDTFEEGVDENQDFQYDKLRKDPALYMDYR
ncbi:hypothetical protein MAR_029318 [Mya arenaria]|uniref:Uncharacterized protein n=1 Tax=Mya arenaria TaxID=6604 RepID=A0ABY7DKL1_MYAAR|nr:hypothetical protein MAR_029318 [Mya arenaria]